VEAWTSRLRWPLPRHRGPADAGIPLVRHYRRTTTGSFFPTAGGFRRHGDETGVIFASAFRATTPGGRGHAFLFPANRRSSYEFDRLSSSVSLPWSRAVAELLASASNTQVNAACASTTMAVAWPRLDQSRALPPRAHHRADDVTSDNLLEWMGAASWHRRGHHRGLLRRRAAF